MYMFEDKKNDKQETSIKDFFFIDGDEEKSEKMISSEIVESQIDETYNHSMSLEVAAD
jgi:hypothetical protein